MLGLELLRVRFPCVLDLILRHLDENDIKHLSSTSSAWNASTKLWRERRLLRRKDLKCPKIISGIKKHLNHGDYPAGVR